MAQIMALDYGKARCGIAATDDMAIIASGLPTVETPEIFKFFENYLENNSVEELVVGFPADLRGNVSLVEKDILQFIEKFKEEHPQIVVKRFDERFTSKIAAYHISQSGKNKKQREQKGLTDKVSATLILQEYLQQKQR